MQSNLCIAGGAAACSGRQPGLARARHAAHGANTRSIKSIHYICYAHMQTLRTHPHTLVCVHMDSIPYFVCKYRKRFAAGEPCAKRRPMRTTAFLQSRRALNVAKCDITFKSNRHSACTHIHTHTIARTQIVRYKVEHVC